MEIAIEMTSVLGTKFTWLLCGGSKVTLFRCADRN